MIQDALTQLTNLQRTITSHNSPDSATDHYIERLYFCDINGLLHLQFYGIAGFDAYNDLLQTIQHPAISDLLKSLELRGPDEGANGTRNWDLEPLLQSNVTFPNLTSIFIEPTNPEDHNLTIVVRDQDYEEAGQLARLLEKAPSLRELTTPSAPDATFFEVGNRPLWYLRVEAGYDTQDFILNLSKSSCFPDLRLLDFKDYSETYDPTYLQATTPCEHYRSFLESPASAKLHTLILRNSQCTPQELLDLIGIRQDVSITAIQTNIELYSRYNIKPNNPKSAI